MCFLHQTFFPMEKTFLNQDKLLQPCAYIGVFLQNPELYGQIHFDKLHEKMENFINEAGNTNACFLTIMKLTQVNNCKPSEILRQQIFIQVQIFFVLLNNAWVIPLKFRFEDFYQPLPGEQFQRKIDSCLHLHS